MPKPEPEFTDVLSELKSKFKKSSPSYLSSNSPAESQAGAKEDFKLPSAQPLSRKPSIGSLSTLNDDFTLPPPAQFSKKASVESLSTISDDFVFPTPPKFSKKASVDSLSTISEEFVFPPPPPPAPRFDHKKFSQIYSNDRIETVPLTDVVITTPENVAGITSIPTFGPARNSRRNRGKCTLNTFVAEVLAFWGLNNFVVILAYILSSCWWTAFFTASALISVYVIFEAIINWKRDSNMISVAVRMVLGIVLLLSTNITLLVWFRHGNLKLFTSQGC